MSTLSQFSGGGIKSIQRGTISIGISQTAATVTITAVNTAKTMLNFCGCSSGIAGTSQSNAAIVANIRLASSTQVTAQSISSNNSFTTSIVSYEVIEYF